MKLRVLKWVEKEYSMLVAQCAKYVRSYRDALRVLVLDDPHDLLHEVALKMESQNSDPLDRDQFMQRFHFTIKHFAQKGAERRSIAHSIPYGKQGEPSDPWSSTHEDGSLEYLILPRNQQYSQARHETGLVLER